MTYSFVNMINKSVTVENLTHVLTSVMKQAIKLTLIPILPIIFSVIDLIGAQQNANYESSHNNTSSAWVIFPDVMIASLGFLAGVTYPYILSKWISFKQGIVLTSICVITNFTFRIVWYFNHSYFQLNSKPDHQYVSSWAAMNDINSYLIVPIISYYFYQKTKTKNNESKQMRDMNINLDYVNLDEISTEDALPINALDSITDEEWKKYEEKLLDPHFNKLSVLYLLMAIWYTILNAFEWYYESVKFSSLYKLPPLVMIAIVLLYELYICDTHKHIRFVHFSLICVFVQVQQLCLFDWSYLVMELNSWSAVGNLNDNLGKLIVFVLYTIYFQFASFIACKLCGHVSVDIERVFELQFVFIFYEEIFLTVYLSQSVVITWSVFVMIIFKIFVRVIQFHHGILQKLPCVNITKQNLGIRYLYSLISALAVFFGQSIFLVVDYFQYSHDGTWLLAADKTEHNLLMGFLIILITFIGHIIAFLMIWYTSKDIYGWNKVLREIPLNMTYFCSVIAMSQIVSFNNARFYPFEA